MNSPLTAAELRALLEQIELPLWLSSDGANVRREDGPVDGEIAHAAFVPALLVANLGDASFRRDHGLEAAYVAGAMANGIGSAEIVEAMSGAGMLGYFGAAGLSLERISATIDRLEKSLAGKSYGFNLIHSPAEPAHEAKTVELYLRRKVTRVEASAFLDLTLPIVRYRLTGICRGTNGRPVAANHVMAKISRVEVATKFLNPAPDKFIRELVDTGDLTEEQADLARRLPMCDDMTAEADSGGHTDNRPAVTLIPTIIALRDRICRENDFASRPRVGAAGGISTPASVAAAFAIGAAYVVGGSIHQACVESGSSDIVRQMLAEADQADVIMAPAADMFEMGVKVQVLKRGTMFAMRGAKLFELYRNHASLEALPAADRQALEKNFFRAPLEEIWRQTRDYFAIRNPGDVERAERDPKHKMALVFRWYLGHASRWANAGEPTRKLDYQVWCGPAMGAFNEWAKGSHFEKPENRRIADVARNLLHGAAANLRYLNLCCQACPLPSGLESLDFRPRPLLTERL